MFCNNCIKLAYLHTKKKCIRCQGEVLNNIAVLCNRCSSNESVCSVCLKNRGLASPNANNYKKSGCRSCGG
jgi:hypothetical protein